MITVIAKKDLVALWTSALPYVVAIVFNAVVGVLFVDQLAGRRQAVVQPLFPIAGFLLLVLIPILTMRTVAEEDRSGTLDVLSAIRVSPAAIITGKWIAVVVTALTVIAPTVLIPLLLSWWGDPDWGPVITGFVGLALLSTAAAAIGVLASSCTRSQAIAAVASSFVGLVLWFASGSASASSSFPGWLARLSVSEHLHSFAGGAIDSFDVAFFVIVTVASLVAAAVCLRARAR